MHFKRKLPDFDTLMHMYQRDPDSYENFRRHLLEEALGECPPQHQINMQYIMMRIEIARQAASTPLESLAYATQLMRESLEELSDRLEELQHELTGLQSLLVLEKARNYSLRPSGPA